MMPAYVSETQGHQPDWLDEIIKDDNALDDRRKLRNGFLGILTIPVVTAIVSVICFHAG